MTPDWLHADDETNDEQEPRTLAEWIADVALIPAAVLFLTSLLFLGTSAAIWATFRLWSDILSLTH